MKRKICIIILQLFIIISLTSAQNEYNTWYFGHKAGMHFNSGSPVALMDGQLNSLEGSAVICDDSGNILFYTNGMEIWDRSHNIMPNGSMMLGDSSSTCAAVIVQHPGNDSLYYVFIPNKTGIGGTEFSYSIVNINLNGGLGDVSSKNNLLF